MSVSGEEETAEQGPWRTRTINEHEGDHENEREDKKESEEQQIVFVRHQWRTANDGHKCTTLGGAF